MLRFPGRVEEGGNEAAPRLGEPVAERGFSKLGRDEDVGVFPVAPAWDEFIRRGMGVEGSRGEAIVDIVDGGGGRGGRGPAVSCSFSCLTALGDVN